ncbi:hypothetical protein ACVWWK_003680 [Bradyrhizobium sp. LB9.1b]
MATRVISTTADGADEVLQQQRIAVADVQRPHGPQRKIECDGKIVPAARNAVAQSRRDPLPVGRRADGFGDLAAALQDDDDDEEMHDQHHHAQERGIAGAMQAEQQRHVGEGDAGDADTDDTTRPDLDIGRGFGPDRKQAERSRQRTDRTDERARERVGIDDREDHEADGGGLADLCAEQRRGGADKDQHRKQLEQEASQHEGQPQHDLPSPRQAVAAPVQFGRRGDIGHG